MVAKLPYISISVAIHHTPYTLFFRYGFMMSLQSVILKVESRGVAGQMWYFPLLKPYVDHVPVRPDLSNLREVWIWAWF
ncbi:hypothetical protein EON63_18940 [archaeon]|nr:MAG: hypothetical protein EON63_18940 [archaeon]